MLADVILGACCERRPAWAPLKMAKSMKIILVNCILRFVFRFEDCLDLNWWLLKFHISFYKFFKQFTLLAPHKTLSAH